MSLSLSLTSFIPQRFHWICLLLLSVCLLLWYNHVMRTGLAMKTGLRGYVRVHPNTRSPSYVSCVPPLSRYTIQLKKYTHAFAHIIHFFNTLYPPSVAGLPLRALCRGVQFWADAGQWTGSRGRRAGLCDPDERGAHRGLRG